MILKRSLGTIGLYLLLAIGYTFPLVLNLASAAPAGEAWTYDGFSMLWNLWWFKHALLELNANPFVTNSIFAPLGVNLYLHTFTLFSDLVALPLLAWLNPVTASNLILIVSLALCGYGMHLLMRYLLVDWGRTQATGRVAGRREVLEGSERSSPGGGIGWRDAIAERLPTNAPGGAALVAGIVFAFTTSRFVYLAEGHYNFVTTQWLPFYMLYLLRAVRQPSLCAVCQAALCLVLALLTELSLGVVLVLVTGFYVLGRLVWSRPPQLDPTVAQHWWGTAPRPPQLDATLAQQPRGTASREPIARRVRDLLPVAGIMLGAAIVSAPYLMPTLRESFDPRYIPQVWGGAAVLSADLVGLFTPSSLHTFFGTHDWPREWQQALENKSRFVGLNSFVIGFGVLGMALAGAVFQPRARRWLWLALALVVLSLGPVLHINGQSTFNLDGMQVIAGLPYVVLHYLPVLNGLRVPQRFSVVAMLCFAVLAGAGAAWVLRRGQNRPLQAVLLAVMIGLVSIEHLTLPVPLADARVPAIYARIAAEPGDFTIMDIPLGWRSGFGPIGTENTRLQYFQTVHGKRLISGFAARTPSFIFDYFKRQPVLNALATLESEGRLPQDAVGRDRAGAAELAYFYDLRYILIHPPAAALTPYDATRQRVHDYIRSVFDIDELSTADGLIVYRVNQPAARASELIDFGSDASSLNRGEGWDANEAIGGATASWMSGTESHVYVPLRTAGRYRVTVRALPFVYDGRPPQTLALQINGLPVGAPVTLADAWSDYAFDVLAGGMQAGLNELMLTASADASPAEVLPGSSDTRRLRLAVDWIRVESVP